MYIQIYICINMYVHATYHYVKHVHEYTCTCVYINHEHVYTCMYMLQTCMYSFAHPCGGVRIPDGLNFRRKVTLVHIREM